MGGTRDDENACPYCGRTLRWVAQRWFGRGVYECEQCGDFPDLAGSPPRAQEGGRPSIGTPMFGPGRRRGRDGRPNVLLVDDSAEYRDLYAVMLEETATVFTASRGEDALTIATTQPLDVVVLDVMMPGMDGWQTCERLKANPRTRSIPVIMLTSLDGLDVPATAARVGAAYVLIKPCSVERLTNAIRAAVRSRSSPP